MSKSKIQLVELPSFPPGNPFLHDLSNMGTPIGKDLLLMHANHPDGECRFLILCNEATGERVKLDLRAFMRLGPTESLFADGPGPFVDIYATKP